jgi:hypothetical protein
LIWDFHERGKDVTKAIRVFHRNHKTLPNIAQIESIRRLPYGELVALAACRCAAITFALLNLY